MDVTAPSSWSSRNVRIHNSTELLAEKDWLLTITRCYNMGPLKNCVGIKYIIFVFLPREKINIFSKPWTSLNLDRGDWVIIFLNSIPAKLAKYDFTIIRAFEKIRIFTKIWRVYLKNWARFTHFNFKLWLWGYRLNFSATASKFCLMINLL